MRRWSGIEWTMFWSYFVYTGCSHKHMTYEIHVLFWMEHLIFDHRNRFYQSVQSFFVKGSWGLQFIVMAWRGVKVEEVNIKHHFRKAKSHIWKCYKRQKICYNLYSETDLKVVFNERPIYTRVIFCILTRRTIFLKRDTMYVIPRCSEHHELSNDIPHVSPMNGHRDHTKLQTYIWCFSV